MVDEVLAAAAAAAVDAEEILSFARALIAAPSENPGGTEDDAAAVAMDILGAIGASAEIIRSDEGRPSIVAAIGSSPRPSLAWNGHLDVVPVGDPSRWTHDPWDGVVEDGRLIGRGSADMKGPVASALGAAAAIRRAGIELEGTLTFHLAADEEHMGMYGTMVLRDRGMLVQDACIVGEPSDMRVGLAERGGAWITATARGKASHGSQPNLGVNAITSMAHLLLRLPEVLPDLEHPLVGRPSVNAAVITGGSAPNVVPDRCELVIDRRIIPGETDPAQVLAPFDHLAATIAQEHPEVDLSFRIDGWTEAAEASADSDIAAWAREAIASERGSRAPDVGFTGITDARFYINDARIPTVILGPGSLTVAHTADEWVLVDDLVTASRIYARIFVGFLGARRG